MTEPIFTAHDSLKWLDATTANWRRLLTENTAILTLPCSIAKTTTVAQLLQHIVAVELRYAERLADKPETDYANIPYDTVEAIYATHDRAIALYTQALDADLNWDIEIEFMTRTMGAARATPKTIFFHAVFHAIRHYAQLATLIREHGYTADWFGDYLVMGLKRA
jgi:uncharacterized damage-inducible protein DinB